LAQDASFDAAAEEIVAVADVIDCIYAAGG